RVRLHVNRVELDPPRREELLRLGAGRSARAIEELDRCPRYLAHVVPPQWNLGHDCTRPLGLSRRPRPPGDCRATPTRTRRLTSPHSSASRAVRTRFVK